jgi:hypothetical protein
MIFSAETLFYINMLNCFILSDIRQGKVDLEKIIWHVKEILSLLNHQASPLAKQIGCILGSKKPNFPPFPVANKKGFKRL